MLLSSRGVAEGSAFSSRCNHACPSHVCHPSRPPHSFSLSPPRLRFGGAGDLLSSYVCHHERSEGSALSSPRDHPRPASFVCHPSSGLSSRGVAEGSAFSSRCNHACPSHVCHPSRPAPLTFVITNEVRDLLFLRLATIPVPLPLFVIPPPVCHHEAQPRDLLFLRLAPLRVPHPFAGLAKGWESVRRVPHSRPHHVVIISSRPSHHEPDAEIFSPARHARHLLWRQSGATQEAPRPLHRPHLHRPAV